MSKEEGVRLWKRLPLGTWVQDSDGKVFQKTTLPDLEIATYQEPTQTEKDANWQRILDMRAANVDASQTPLQLWSQEPTQTEKDANWQRILDMRAGNVDGSATPAPMPRGSRTNPYRIEWRQKGWLKRWQALPYGSYYNDRHGEPTQKLSAELPVADVFVDVPGGFADEEEALAALPLGCPSRPYQINWSAADAYEHFKNVPSYSFYVEWDGSIKQKP